MESGGRRGARELEQDLERQIELMGTRAPSYRGLLSELLELLRAPGSSLGRAFERAWQRRSFAAFYERPLLVLACIRHDALIEGESHPLWASVASDQAALAIPSREQVAAAIAPERLGVWMALRTRRVQTNEVRRAVTWLWPAALAGGRRPIALADVGASAGLNLVADGVELEWLDQAGAALPIARRANLIARLGFDTRPLDALRLDDVRWLRACVWAGETERLRLLDAALAAFERAAPRPEVTQLTASAVPARLGQLLRTMPDDGLLLAYHTLVLEYLPAPERDGYEQGMLELLRSAPRGRAAWLTLELADESDLEHLAALQAHVATGGEPARLQLARAGYHPTTLVVDQQAAREFASLTG
jgi:hypothetical protein